VSRCFGYTTYSHCGDHPSRRHDVPAEGFYTHFEPRHLDGPRFPHRGSCPTHSNGEVQMTVKTSSGRMVKSWIPKFYLTNPSTEPLTLALAHGFQLLTTHEQKQEMVLQPHSPVTQGVCDFWG
jgi:hypothetical protein